MTPQQQNHASSVRESGATMRSTTEHARLCLGLEGGAGDRSRSNHFRCLLPPPNMIVRLISLSLSIRVRLGGHRTIERNVNGNWPSVDRYGMEWTKMIPMDEYSATKAIAETAALERRYYFNSNKAVLCSTFIARYRRSIPIRNVSYICHISQFVSSSSNQQLSSGKYRITESIHVWKTNPCDLWFIALALPGRASCWQLSKLE